MPSFDHLTQLGQRFEKAQEASGISVFDLAKLLGTTAAVLLEGVEA